MNISPGNLYYHYRNREEIVRVLMERMYCEFNNIYLGSKPSGDPVSSVSSLMDNPVSVMYRYRFFYMEPVNLLERDPLLKKMYFNMKKRRVKDFSGIFELFTAAGILRKNITGDEFEAAFNNIWALNEFIIQSMYMNNEKITEANMKKNFMRIMYIIKPFITEEYRDRFFPG